MGSAVDNIFGFNRPEPVEPIVIPDPEPEPLVEELVDEGELDKRRRERERRTGRNDLVINNPGTNAAGGSGLNTSLR